MFKFDVIMQGSDRNGGHTRALSSLRSFWRVFKNKAIGRGDLQLRRPRRRQGASGRQTRNRAGAGARRSLGT